MDSYREKQVMPETISQKLAKSPLLLIVLTASLSFGVQLIPFRTVWIFLHQSFKALLQASTYQFGIQESFQPLLTPHVFLAFVFFAIPFILYTSHRDKGESKFEDQNNSFVEPRKGLLYRTATMGQSIFAYLIPQAEDEHTLSSRDAIAAINEEVPLQKQLNTNDNVMSNIHDSGSVISEKKYVKSAPENIPLSSTRASRTKKKLPSPATSTGYASKDRSNQYIPKSLREDPSKLHKKELNRRFELPKFDSDFESYLRNVLLEKQRHKDLNQSTAPELKDYSTQSADLDPKLNCIPKSLREDSSKLDRKELDRRFELPKFDSDFESYLRNVLLEKQRHKDLNQSNAPELKDYSTQSAEPSSVPASLSFNDASFIKDDVENELPTPEVNEDLSEADVNEDLSEADVNERIDLFLSSYEGGFKREISETKAPQQREWHSNSYPATRSVNTAAIETPTPELRHSFSQITRRDSLAIANQMFDSFVQKIRNEFRLQKQKSNLRYQFPLADVVSSKGDVQ